MRAFGIGSDSPYAKALARKQEMRMEALRRKRQQMIADGVNGRPQRSHILEGVQNEVELKEKIRLHFGIQDYVLGLDETFLREVIYCDHVAYAFMGMGPW